MRSGALLTGNKYYKLMQDNYYQTVELAVHNRNVLCAGTAQKKHIIIIDREIYFGGATQTVPSLPQGHN